MAQNLANLIKNIYIQESQWIPRRRNKEIHTETHYSQAVKSQRQRQNPESSKREATCYIQGILHKINSWFLLRNCEDSGSEMTYLKYWKKNIVNQEFYIQQNYPSKNDEEIKIFPDKQKLREFASGRPVLQEMLKIVL